MRNFRSLFETLTADQETDRLSPTIVDPLPEPVRSYFGHAIAPGSRLATTATIAMHGRIRVGRWMPFRAREILAPRRGFWWRARAGWWPLLIRGYDVCIDGEGASRFRVLGVIPVVHAAGADVARSACGRAAIESVLVPPALLPRHDVEWEATGDDEIVATIYRWGQRSEVHLRIDGRGALVEAWMQRWGNPGGQFGYHPFGIRAEEELTRDGLTIPRRFRAGWWFGTERFAQGECFDAQIDDVRFR